MKGRGIGLYVIEKSTRKNYEEICEGRLMKKDENTSEIEIIEYYDTKDGRNANAKKSLVKN
mgnify:CR=1 FL=1